MSELLDKVSPKSVSRIGTLTRRFELEGAGRENPEPKLAGRHTMQQVLLIRTQRRQFQYPERPRC